MGSLTCYFTLALTVLLHMVKNWMAQLYPNYMEICCIFMIMEKAAAEQEKADSIFLLLISFNCTGPGSNFSEVTFFVGFFFFLLIF